MRLFLAVNLPERTRRALWEAAAQLRAGHYPVRWVEPDAIHITLKFLGDVPDARESEIRTALGPVVHGAKPFAVALEGFGAFPSPHSPRVPARGAPVPSPPDARPSEAGGTAQGLRGHRRATRGSHVRGRCGRPVR
jgi:2'-5' RNA ligase